jgi:hypothetical protein
VGSFSSRWIGMESMVGMDNSGKEMLPILN